MKKIIVFVLLLIPCLIMSQEIAVKPDSSNVEADKVYRDLLVIGGKTGEEGDSGLYRQLLVDWLGALRDASFDSVTVDTLQTIGTDTVLVDDDFSFSPTIIADLDIRVRTQHMGANEWIYIKSGTSITLPLIVSNGDTVFVSTATMPDFQMIRGRVK